MGNMKLLSRQLSRMVSRIVIMNSPVGKAWSGYSTALFLGVANREAEQAELKLSVCFQEIRYIAGRSM
jgi:hypothetical protein